MKQFEKWLDKNHRHWRKFPCTTSTYKEGWRAALEWALRAGKDGNCGMCYTESVIEEELKGGD